MVVNVLVCIGFHTIGWVMFGSPYVDRLTVVLAVCKCWLVSVVAAAVAFVCCRRMRVCVAFAVRTRNGRHVPHTTARFCCLRCRRCCRGDDDADGGGLALFGYGLCCLLTLFLVCGWLVFWFVLDFTRLVG